VRPLIGITIGPSDTEPAYLRLRSTYPRAIEAAGGLPVLLPPMATPTLEALLGRLDGLVFPGGLDVDPAEYGQAPHPKTVVNSGLDAHELSVARWAALHPLPTLGICRGQQLLNVALGGSLHQHLDGHELRVPAGSHVIDVEAGSRLSGILGGTRCEVNSRHHQAVDALGHGLRAVAWAADGTIEGIESVDHPWLLAVQFHPEDLVSSHAPSQLLFESFVNAAKAKLLAVP
jgi:putative glutamine amidotransferase